MIQSGEFISTVRVFASNEDDLSRRFRSIVWGCVSMFPGKNVSAEVEYDEFIALRRNKRKYKVHVCLRDK